MHTTTKKRRAHYTPQPDPRCPHMRLTGRDIDMLVEILKHRFLRSNHLIALTAGGRQAILKRIRRLYDHGYLVRLREPITWYREPGSKPKIYALGNAGADVLAEQRGISRGEINWQLKNERVGQPHIEHTLAVADVMVHIELDSRKKNDLNYIDSDELFQKFSVSTRNKKNPYRFQVDVPGKERTDTLGAAPDKVFAFEVAWQSAERNRRHILLELDRGTEPNLRHTKALTTQTSILKKIMVYSEAYKQKLHKEQYHWASFRVAIVTTNAERVSHILALIRKLTKECDYRSDLFYVTDFDSFSSHNTFDLQWCVIKKGEEERVTILE